jgi:folate-binding protein YgfZ
VSHPTQAAHLPERGVIKVSGLDSRRFLNGLLTADIDAMRPGPARYAALLTPQGKIIADFLVVEAEEADGGGFFLDCPRPLTDLLIERLTFYKLRAKVDIADLSAQLAVLAIWGSADPAADRPSEYGLSYPDPRAAALGLRVLAPVELLADVAAEYGAILCTAEDYDAHRIALGIPRGGADFAYNDTYPHEADMDQLGGVDFDKGCYVGQEVVSRVEHRSTARSRVVPIAYDDYAPMGGLPVVAGDKQIGMLGSTAKGRGLALIRLDRAADAMAKGAPLTAGGVTLRLVKPAWARFSFPGETGAP